MINHDDHQYEPEDVPFLCGHPEELLQPTAGQRDAEQSTAAWFGSLGSAQPRRKSKADRTATRNGELLGLVQS